MVYPSYAIRLKSVEQLEDNSSLAHFGIKGQRWGVRRFQNKDRSLTEAGKIRYGVVIKEKKAEWKKRTDADRAKVAKDLDRRIKIAKKQNEEAADKLMTSDFTDSDGSYSRSYLNKDRSDREIKDLKILQKINNQKYISSHRLKLEEKYMQRGMNAEQAKIAAYKRDRNEKIFAVATATTMAVAGAWLYKNHMADIDKIIPKDTLLQNLSADPNRSVNDPFFAAYDPRDKQKYLRLFGGDHMQQAANNPIMRMFGAKPVDVQKMSVQAMQQMKIAGANIGLDTANELLTSDGSYRDALKGMLRNHGVGSNKQLGLLMEMNGMAGYRNVQDAIYSGKKLNKAGYGFINQMLVDHTPDGQDASSKLFGALRKKGYDGTIDLNDVFRSGYDANAPVVIFNGGSKLGNIKRATIDPATLRAGADIEKAKIYAKQLLNIAVPGSAALSGVSKAGEIYRRKKSERSVIANYKKEHPNTKMTDRQILESVVGRS